MGMGPLRAKRSDRYGLGSYSKGDDVHRKCQRRRGAIRSSCRRRGRGGFGRVAKKIRERWIVVGGRRDHFACLQHPARW